LSIITLAGAIFAVGYAQPPFWTSSKCGRSKYEDAGDQFLPSGYIVGGIESRPYEFPWQVSVRRKSSNSHFCGGIIISERWILTAAHCMDGETPAIVSIVVGDWQRSAASTVRQTLDVEVITMHPGYVPDTYENDISVVKVTTDIVFSEDVAPVCAPDPANDYVFYKSQCSGWGSLSSGGSCCPDILRYVTMNITTNAFCEAAYSRYSYPITDDMICSTDNIGSTERDSCQGDSGGPLTIKEADGVFRVAGIVSWGIGCASGFPGVYARAGFFAQWITDNID